MEESMAALYRQLTPDVSRKSLEFSPDIESFHQKFFTGRMQTDQIGQLINGWIQRQQPCLFGRIAAKLGLMSYCVLEEQDLLGPETRLREKIQDARTEWKRLGFMGAKSGFVILAVSPVLALAEPGKALRDLAQRLCSLYLLREIEIDRIELDEIFLEIPGSKHITWKWQTGVNFFAAQGDKRWWHDHRIPGGIALSVNSVGHMVKTGKLAGAFKDLEKSIGETLDEELVLSRVDSLEKALELAMRTIQNASHTASGKATELIPLAEGTTGFQGPKCPIELPASLAAQNHCEYRGRYHTDITLPSEYFRPDVHHPTELSAQVHKLDFTYLFDDRLDNPDFLTMGRGMRIRTQDSFDTALNNQLKGWPAKVLKRKKGMGTEVPLKKLGKLGLFLRQSSED